MIQRARLIPRKLYRTNKVVEDRDDEEKQWMIQKIENPFLKNAKAKKTSESTLNIFASY